MTGCDQSGQTVRHQIDVGGSDRERLVALEITVRAGDRLYAAAARLFDHWLDDLRFTSPEAMPADVTLTRESYAALQAYPSKTATGGR